MAPAASGPSFDAEQIAFVTRRYEALRGLSNAGMGACLVAASVTMQFLYASTGYPLSSHATVMFALNAPSMAALEFEFRYQATFGRAEAPFQFATIASWTGLFVLMGTLIDALVMDRAATRWPSAAGIGLALSSGLVLLMDWRWRPHYAVPFFAGLVAVAMTASVEPAKYFPSWESDPLRTPVLLLANGFVGLGLVTSGMLDHRLLTRTLTPFHGAAGTSASMRARAANARTNAAAVICGSALVTLGFPARHMAIVLPFALMMSVVGLVVYRHLVRRFRPGTPHAWENPEPIGLHPDTTIIVVLLAAAGLMDMAFRWPAPIASTLAFAFASFWIALRDWPVRMYYLVGAVAPMVLLPLAVRLEPARSFTLLLFVCAAALALESYFDGRGEHSSSSPGPEDADTV